MDRGMETVETGVPGLDELLRGGLVPGRMYLVQGTPGTGKTLLGMSFLSHGLDRGENGLFIHGEESREDILANSHELGIDLEGAEFLDLGPESEFFSTEQSYDLVDPTDIETNQFIDDVGDAVEELNPDRVCIDPITQLRYVETSSYQFRKRLISFMRFLKDRGTTVVATRTTYGATPDDDIASLSDGIIELSHDETSRRISVPKHRGAGQRSGEHGLAIRQGGLEVYPSLVPEDHTGRLDRGLVSSGIEELDALLGGGIQRGTATFVSGPTGVGKTTTATQFLAEAAAEGDSPAAYLFEESLASFTTRSEALGIPVTDLRGAGDLSVEVVEPLALSPEEFASHVRRDVEEGGTDTVLIDGIDGYTLSLQGDETMLARKLHALVRYLTNVGVTVLVVDTAEQISGLPRATSANVSYVADNILFLSYLEMEGELRRVMGVLKKRIGGFEHTLREFSITADGLKLGKPLTDVQGVLGGNPEPLGPRSSRSDGG